MSESSLPNARPSLLSDRAYDVLKAFVTVVLPGLGALYFALGQLWHFPHTEQVVGSIAALNAFGGALLKLSSYSYDNSDAKYLGEVDTSTDPETGRPKLLFSVDGGKLDTLSANAKDVTFKVNNSN